jgi:hypothetical protein
MTADRLHIKNWASGPTFLSSFRAALLKIDQILKVINQFSFSRPHDFGKINEDLHLAN